jgi:flagellar biosynthetic protein FlhB
MASKSERTEKPTPKHKKEMREKGNVARSPELGGWASLLLVSSLLPTLGGNAATRISGFVQDTMQAMGHPSTTTAVAILGQGLSTLVVAALPILAVGGALAVAIAVAQVGFRITPKALSFKFSRISPKSGIHKVVSSQGVWTLGKTLLKMIILAVVGYLILHQLINGVLGGSTLPLETTLASASSTVVNLMRFIGVLALAIAAFDYYFQRRTYQQELKMTKQEVKDENRQNDGNPHVRQAQRRKARRLTRMHMMAAVANADVVVTNPTHYAVAIAYDRKKDRAPRVLAKGADFNALAIRERAKACGVVIVENAPLARTLHASCEVNDVVPAQLYASVARLLAFVYSISPTARVLRDVHTMAS